MTTNPSDSPREQVRVSGRPDLAALVPYLLGFHPNDSLAVVSLRGESVVHVMRSDLVGEDDAPAGADGLCRLLRQIEDLTAVVMVGYGSQDRVAPLLAAAWSAFTFAGYSVKEALRVDAGRLYSYFCPVEGCCPPEGVPFDPATTAVAAASAYAGIVAARSREDLVRELDPVRGAARESVRAATAAARRRRRASADDGADPSDRRARMTRQMEDDLRAAMASIAAGDGVSEELVASLSVALADDYLRDQAVRVCVDQAPAAKDERLYAAAALTDVVRRCDRDLRAHPAALLALVCCLRGDVTRGLIALERALEVDPWHPLALRLDEVLADSSDPEAIRGAFAR